MGARAERDQEEAVRDAVERALAGELRTLEERVAALPVDHPRRGLLLANAAAARALLADLPHILIPTGIDLARRPRTPDASGGAGASSEVPTHLLGPALPDAPGASRAARSESASVGITRG